MSIASILKTIRPILAAFAAIGIVVGLLARLAGRGVEAEAVWISVTVPILLSLVIEIVTSVRRGEFGLDIVAALSMSAALVFGQELAAAIVALMYSGGQYLESYAERRARHEMTALLARMPRIALRHHDGQLEEIALDQVHPGDRLLIRRGDVLPVDGNVSRGIAVLDRSALTGEAMPVQFRAGEPVVSGASNVGDAFDMIATHRAAESTYAGVVRLVEAAQHSRAPMSRLADRYAILFLAATVLLSTLAWWLTKDPIRLVAVLVVATPCPLILAVPVAFISGLSRAAKLGILIKGGKILEALAQVRSIVIDKTGTLTLGEARLIDIRASAAVKPEEVLRIAASLDQASKHVIAQTITAEAHKKGLLLTTPADVVETPGEGLAGRLNGQMAIVGGPHFVAGKLGAALPPLLSERPPGALAVAVAADGKPIGVLIFADELRAGIEVLLHELRQFGIERIVLATGDRLDVARFVAAGLPIDAVRAELTPDQKVLVVLSERKNGPVMMIGDGVNDAPALAAADVGIAMGAKGAAASAEVADVVLLVDQLDRVLPAMRIARRSRRIALQSVIAGIGFSIAGMIAAALGFLPPVQGALFQEFIDVAVIFNALRALRG